MLFRSLMDESADDQGMALGYLLLCKEAGLSGELVEGTRLLQTEPPGQGNGEGSESEETPLPEEPQAVTRRWAVLTIGGETLYLDPSQKDTGLFSAQEMFELGYRWPGGPREPEVQAQNEEITENEWDGEEKT